MITATLVIKTGASGQTAVACHSPATEPTPMEIYVATLLQLGLAAVGEVLTANQRGVCLDPDAVKGQIARFIQENTR